MTYRNIILGPLIFFNTQAYAQGDINDFLSGQVFGNEVFLEYDYTAVLDSIDALNAALSSAQASAPSQASASPEWGVYFQIGTDIVGEAEFDLSGYSVSLSPDGTVVAIGAPFNNDMGTNAGHVRIYSWL